MIDRDPIADADVTATLAQPVEADDIRRPREVQLLLEQLAAVGLTLAPLRGPTLSEQRGMARALTVAARADNESQLSPEQRDDLRAARRWWNAAEIAAHRPSNAALRRAVGIAGSYHVALAELRGDRQCPGGRWPKCEGQLDD